LTLVSSWDFTLEQFQRFRQFIVLLAVADGIQIGLF